MACAESLDALDRETVEVVRLQHASDRCRPRYCHHSAFRVRKLFTTEDSSESPADLILEPAGGTAFVVTGAGTGLSAVDNPVVESAGVSQAFKVEPEPA